MISPAVPLSLFALCYVCAGVWKHFFGGVAESDRRSGYGIKPNSTPGSLAKSLTKQISGSSPDTTNPFLQRRGV